MMAIKRGGKGFEVQLVDKPEISSEDECLVKVISAGINPVDYKAPPMLVGPIVG